MVQFCIEDTENNFIAEIKKNSSTIPEKVEIMARRLVKEIRVNADFKHEYDFKFSLTAQSIPPAYEDVVWEFSVYLTNTNSEVSCRLNEIIHQVTNYFPSVKIDLDEVSLEGLISSVRFAVYIDDGSY